MYTNALCAVEWVGYIADIAVALIALVMLIVCAKKGFINCFFGTISTLVALIIAFSFAKSVLTSTNGLFGLQSWFYKTFEESFAKLQGFDADVSAQGVETALKENNVSALLASLVLKVAGKQETIEAGTTLAMLLAEATSALAATICSGLALFILIKIGVRIIRGILNAVAEKLPLIKGLNILLGAVVGVLQVVLIVCTVLAILTVFPIVSVSEYLDNTLYLGWLAQNNPLVNIIGMFL